MKKIALIALTIFSVLNGKAQNVSYNLNSIPITGSTNTAFGINTLLANTTGTGNVAVGYLSLHANTTGAGNVALGQVALTANTTGNSNTANGWAALQNNTNGSNNTAIGSGACGFNISGIGNTGNGYFSLVGNTVGNYNTALGLQAGQRIQSGSANTIIGANSTSAGDGIVSGNANTIIGANVTGLSAALSNTVILADGSGNQRLFIDNNGNAGLGTTTPNTRLEVNSGATNISGLRFTQLTGLSPALFSNSKALTVDNSGNVVLTPMSGGTGGSSYWDVDGSGNIINNNSAAVIVANGSSTTGYSGLRFSQLNSSSTTVSGNSKALTVDGSGNVVLTDMTGGTGTSYFTSSAIGGGYIKNTNSGGIIIGDDLNLGQNSTSYKLYVSKGILTEKLKIAVQPNWPDYVFEAYYKLRPVAELEAFIKNNKHLPGVPSSVELGKDGGIDVNQMLSKQLEKIEELTLYIIQMKKEIQELQKTNNTVKSKINN